MLKNEKARDVHHELDRVRIDQRFSKRMLSKLNVIAAVGSNTNKLLIMVGYHQFTAFGHRLHFDIKDQLATL